MAKATKFQVVLPDGGVATRSTQSMAYTWTLNGEPSARFAPATHSPDCKSRCGIGCPEGTCDCDCYCSAVAR